MTLIELTVVILVIFSLIGVTFVGVSAWKRGSDRTIAILEIRSAQMGMRTHCQIEGIEGSTLTDLPDFIFGQGKYVPNGIDRGTGLPKEDGELPEHPVSGQNFDFVAGSGDIIPAYGELYICTGGGGSLTDYTYNPQPAIYKQW